MSSYAYNTHKKARRHSKPKAGHQVRKGDHHRRLPFAEKIRFLFKRGIARGHQEFLDQEAARSASVNQNP